MKRIEKLAREWVGSIEPAHISPYHFQKDCESFEAGFRAACEMALQCVLNGENIPTSYLTQDIEAAISALGEDEVPDGA